MKGRLCLCVFGQFPRVRGRGWNRGNYPGNNSNGNPANMNPVVRPPEEEWDPEYTPKSRKYYLVSCVSQDTAPWVSRSERH